MRMRRLLASALAAVTGIGAAATIGSPASAHAADVSCISAQGVKGCYHYQEHVLYLTDTLRDGMSAEATFTMYNSPGGWYSYYNCWNSNGTGTTTSCAIPVSASVISLWFYVYAEDRATGDSGPSSVLRAVPVG